MAIEKHRLVDSGGGLLLRGGGSRCSDVMLHRMLRLHDAWQREACADTAEKRLQHRATADA